MLYKLKYVGENDRINGWKLLFECVFTLKPSKPSFLTFETAEKTSLTKTLQLDHFFGGQLQLSLRRLFVFDFFTTQKLIDRLLRSLLNILRIRLRIHLLMGAGATASVPDLKANE